MSQGPAYAEPLRLRTSPPRVEDLTPEQADRLIRILRDRLGLGFIIIGAALGVSRKVAETRYLRLHGTTFYRTHTDCGALRADRMAA